MSNQGLELLNRIVKRVLLQQHDLKKKDCVVCDTVDLLCRLMMTPSEEMESRR